MSLTAAPPPVADVPVARSVAAVAGPERGARSRADVKAAALVALAMAGSVLLWGPGIRTWYWIDEVLSVGIAKHALTAIPALLRIDGSPPLWYLLLACWTRLVGDGPVATHLLSLAVASACVPVAWWGGHHLGGRRTAIYAAVLTATSPFLGYFARETRMYTLVVLLSLLVPVLFVRAFAGDDRRATIAFTGALVALLYTHNWGLYSAIGALVALVPILVAVPDRRPVLRRALLVFGAVGLAYLPWLPTLLSQVLHTGAPWSFTPSARDLVRELAALVHDERVLLLLVLAAGSGLAPLLLQRRGRDFMTASVLLSFAGVPVAIGWGMSHLEPSWATRYLAVIVGPLLLLAALGLARAGGTGTAALVMVVLLLVQPMTRLDGGLRYPLDAKSNAAAVADALRPLLRPGDLVIVAQPEAVPLVSYYLGDGIEYADPTGVVADPDVMDWRDAEHRLRSAAPTGALGAALDRLRPGQHVVLVRPAGKGHRTDTDWIKLIRFQASTISADLGGRPNLVLRSGYARKPRSFISLRAVVYDVLDSRATS